MKTISKKTNYQIKNPVTWILGGLVVITLYFQTTLADPFNSPKLWILMLLGAWLLGYVFGYRRLIFLSEPLKQIGFILSAFLIFMLIATLLTDFKYVAFFGETQRRNGFFQYLALSIVLMASAMFTRFFNINKLLLTSVFVGIVSFTYSLMQTTGNDFVSWDNPYNSVIGTLGNPNFAAAVMAILGVISFSLSFNSNFKPVSRVLALVLVLMLVLMIYRSNARQGLLSIGIGSGLFLVIWMWSKNKKLGIFSLISGLIILIFSVLGMLQIGPLQQYLYKASVSVRGYYWRAGLEMFSNNPFFGVGIDRYGSYFKQYREVDYPLNIGFQLTSTNAHNTFIQFFATGGVFVGISYLLLNLFVLYRAIVGLKNLKGNERVYLIGILSAWISFHAQSLVSIDNIGISIWGWVLAGSIIGLSLPAEALVREAEFYSRNKRNDVEIGQALISGVSTILILGLVVILYRGESNSYLGGILLTSQDEASRSYYKDLQLKVIHTPLNDPSYKLFAASKLIDAGFEEGLIEAERLREIDPRNLDNLKLLAITYERLNNLSQAIKFRKLIANLDPWNAENYLALGRYYKFQGDVTQSQIMLEKILSFASKHPIAKVASVELGQD
jgi:O-antigen ligase